MAKDEFGLHRLARLREHVEAEAALRREIECGSISGRKLLIGDQETAGKLQERREPVPVHQIPTENYGLDAHAVDVGAVDGENFIHGHELAAKFEVAVQNARKVIAGQHLTNVQADEKKLRGLR